MKRAKKAIAILIVLVLCVSLFAACKQDDTDTTGGAPGGTTGGSPGGTTGGSNSPAPNPPEMQVPEAPPEGAQFAEHIVWVGTESVPTFDATEPASTSRGSIWSFNLIYNQLFKDTPGGTIEPALATSWESSDLQTFTFQLRDDVYFHNGEKFTADDVAYNIDRALASPGTQVYDRWAMVDSYDVVNDYEIVIRLSRVNVDFVANLSWPACGMVNRAACEADPERGYWIGTGAWIVDEFVPNDHTTWRRNENYWGEVPVTKLFTLRTVTEETARVAMLESGEANVVYSLQPQSVPYIIDNPNLELTSYTLTNIMYLGFNTSVPITSDVNFRRAVAYAIDRQTGADLSRDGYATIPDNPIFWGYRTEFRNTDVPKIERNLDTAREYLAASSYNGETIEILTSNPQAAIIAQVYLTNLAEIGITITVRETDQAGAAAIASWGSTQTQMMISGAEFQQWASSARGMLYPGVVGNRAQYNNPEVVALFDEAAATLDAAERERLYRRIQEIVAEDIPYLTNYHMEQVIGITQGIGGIMFMPNGMHDISGIYMVAQ